MAEQFLFARNLARDPTVHTARALRPRGHRTGFLLSDGRRIRRGGARRAPLRQDVVMVNYSRLRKGLEEGYVEITTRDGKVFTPEDLDKFCEVVTEPLAAPRKEGQETTGVPVPAEPEPVIEEVEAADTESEEEIESVETEEVDDEDEVWDLEELMAMKRAALNQLAAEEGIESPDKFPNKTSLIEALVGKEG